MRRYSIRCGAPALVIACLTVAGPVRGQPMTPERFSRWIRKRPEIEQVTITGNHALNSNDIRRLMEIAEPGMMERLGLRRRPRLLKTSLRRDKEIIRREYVRLGYWKAAVDITAVPAGSDDHARVVVAITEGPRVYWGHATLEGDRPELVARLKPDLASLKRGQPADSLALALTRMRMISACADNGHPAARISAVVTPRRDTMDVFFTLTSGPRVVLGTITIEGLSHTRESVVRRELRLKAGDEFSRKQLDERQQDVYATGLFKFVRLEPQFTDSGLSPDIRRADLHLRVIERKPSYIGFRTGAGQDPDRDLTWDYALEWGSRNWLGTGRKWTLTAQSAFVVVSEWRALHHRFSARYVEPWILGIRLPTALEIAFEPGIRAPTQDYRLETTSAELNVTRRVRRVYRIWSSLVYERLRITGVPEERREEFLKEEGLTIKRRWTSALERDTRSNTFVPTDGSRTRVDMEYVGGILGGANDFYKVDVSWARYQIISEPTVFASRIRLGWTGLHSGGSFVPSIDRFYLGGANSIRGYTENTVGPVDSLGAPLGGKVVTLVNLELRTPVSRKFWFTLFGDAGNNWASFEDIALRRLLLSIGVGWEYIAPVGPIRLDYARRVVHPGHPRSDRVHLSILFSF